MSTRSRSNTSPTRRRTRVTRRAAGKRQPAKASSKKRRISTTARPGRDPDIRIQTRPAPVRLRLGIPGFASLLVGLKQLHLLKFVFELLREWTNGPHA